jgi:hypothetical protein
MMAGVAGDWRPTGEAGSAAMIESAEFRHFDQHDNGGRVAGPRDAGQDAEAGLDLRDRIVRAVEGVSSSSG